MASTRGLDPRYQPIAERLLAHLKSLSGGFVLTSGLRSHDDQVRLYEKFLRGEGGVYTVLPPGRSQHERGLAVDIARIGVEPKQDPILKAVGVWWRTQGGVWGGEADPVHFEATRAWTGRS